MNEVPATTETPKGTGTSLTALIIPLRSWKSDLLCVSGYLSTSGISGCQYDYMACSRCPPLLIFLKLLESHKHRILCYVIIEWRSILRYWSFVHLGVSGSKFVDVAGS